MGCKDSLLWGSDGFWLLWFVFVGWVLVVILLGWFWVWVGLWFFFVFFLGGGFVFLVGWCCVGVFWGCGCLSDVLWFLLGGCSVRAGLRGLFGRCCSEFWRFFSMLILLRYWFCCVCFDFVV